MLEIDLCCGMALQIDTYGDANTHDRCRVFDAVHNLVIHDVVDFNMLIQWTSK